MPTLTLPASHPSAPAVRAKALVFEDPRSRALLEQIERIAPTTATVLITGETGTGKEIVARHLHEASKRRERPFVAVNCGAFAEQLVESELFGHERGAFTGAASPKAGWFETAHKSSLFLDEVGDLSLALQVKLLRVIQEAEVVRLGSRVAIPVDVRLIAATNVDLERAMAAGHFREDLFYRLNVTSLHLPALRERPKDIVPLARHFVGVYSKRLGLPNAELSQDAEQRLLEHSWPGNIRELENVVHHARMVCKGDEIGAHDLRIKLAKPQSVPPPAALSARASHAPLPTPAQLASEHNTALARELVPQASAPERDGFELLQSALSQLFAVPTPELYARISQTVFQQAFSFAQRNQLKTARLLGVSRNVVRARLLEAGDIAGTPRVRGVSAAIAAGSTARSRSQRVRLSIGYHRFGLLTLAKALGTFEAALAEIDTEWVEYPAGPELVAALQSGEVAFGVVGDCPSVLAQASEAPFVYVAAEAPAPEAAAIIVHGDSRIKTVRDLRGRAVALKRGSNVHYLLIKALEEANVRYEDVRLVFAPPARAHTAFEQRQVDAWVIWDPLLTSMRQSGGARVLRDGSGLTQNSAFYLANRGFAERYPDLLEELVAQTRNAVDWARTNTEAAAQRMSAQLDISPRAIAAWLGRFPSPRPLSRELVDSQQQIADTLHRMRLLPRPVRVADATWHRLVG